MAISCTPELLSSLSDLAKQYDPPLAIQTHLDENLLEIEFVRKLFPESASYTAVYDDFGLLGPGTILAHCVHLSQEERTLIAQRGAGVSHCPTSNFYIDSGCARVREMLQDGIKVSCCLHELCSQTDARSDSEAIARAATRTRSYPSFASHRRSPTRSRTSPKTRTTH
jgi:guanine deaminase